MARPKHFVIIGAQRCGTTSLAQALEQHPDVEFAQPTRPEPKYFMRSEPISASDYRQRHFSTANALNLGEKSTSYVEYPNVAQKLLGALPHVKVICLLRNPIERAISNHAFTAKHGLDPRPAEQALRMGEPKPTTPIGLSVSPFDYLERSNYWHHLEPWVNDVPSDQIHIALFERLEQSLSQIAAYLGLDQPDQLSLPHTNTAPRRTPISPTLRRELEHHFAPQIERLDRELDLNAASHWI